MPVRRGHPARSFGSSLPSPPRSHSFLLFSRLMKISLPLLLLPLRYSPHEVRKRRRNRPQTRDGRAGGTRPPSISKQGLRWAVKLRRSRDETRGNAKRGRLYCLKNSDRGGIPRRGQVHAFKFNVIAYGRRRWIPPLISQTNSVGQGTLARAGGELCPAECCPCHRAAVGWSAPVRNEMAAQSAG